MNRIKEALDHFSRVTGWTTNTEKSTIFIAGIANTVKSKLLEIIGYKRVTASLMHVKADEEECMVWHRELGHPSFNTLKKLVPTISRHTDDCLICPLAKKTRLPFPLPMIESTCIFDL